MPVNRLAVISFVVAVLALISFCIGFAPFLPLTALVCYPAAVFWGAIAFLTGFIALRQMRACRQRGRWMALTGIAVGSLALPAVLCETALSLTILVAGLQSLFSLWPTPGP
ncbi:MAG: DUF4190 domain-containing protein [Anaerolineales bacterium]|nr:DUF4190 domain-containing protein [Anaerolineales bacterium]MDW8278571.1 DUF4190 domain-containing protein [Anaerolineales bacterium]